MWAKDIQAIAYSNLQHLIRTFLRFIAWVNSLIKTQKNFINLYCILSYLNAS